MADTFIQIRKMVQHPFFRHGILITIIFAAVLLGLETNPALYQEYASTFHFLNGAILVIFTLEAILKLASFAPSPWRYFRDSWNLFDFLILIACFIPSDSPWASVLRLARILRVLRLASALPELQLLVNALLRSIPSMGYVGLLLVMLIYVYAVIGVTFFGKNDPIHFGNLGSSMLSLFQTTTLEGWADLMYDQLRSKTSDTAPWVVIVYFVSYILLGTMIMLNLFIGIVLNGMQEIQKEHQLLQSTSTDKDPRNEIKALEQELDRLKDRLKSIRLKL